MIRSKSPRRLNTHPELNATNRIRSGEPGIVWLLSRSPEPNPNVSISFFIRPRTSITVTFWEHFLRLLPHKPARALTALYWYVAGRKVNAHNRLRAASADLPFLYDLWIRRVERADALAPHLDAMIRAWPWQPRFIVLLYTDGAYSMAEQQRSMRSVERQFYPHWDVVAPGTKPIDSALEEVDADYLLPLRVGDELADLALFRLGERLQKDRNAKILYGDHDYLDHRGCRVRPWFKPQWNAEMFLAYDFLSPVVAVEANLAWKSASTGCGPFDIHTFLLKATAASNESIIHVPHILCHAAARSFEPSNRARIACVARHVEQLGAKCLPGPFMTAKVSWPLPDVPPMVSIIIPTRDKAHLLRACIESVLKRTSYGRFEIIIVDNDSREPATLAYLGEIEGRALARVLRYDHPYNYSAINNFAATQVDGAYLCLLNNDTEVIEPEWLNEMMRYAVRREIGAVGAKLLYPDRTIQHAGLVVGIGGAAGHAHRFAEADRPGYFLQAHVPQFASAVTAACLVVAKSKFLAVGGFDEVNLPIALNDVDLCLKLQAAGWRNAYVPHAVLLHHESKSRGSDMSPAHRERFRQEVATLQDRWGTNDYEDPLHNPNLDRACETYVLRM